MLKHFRNLPIRRKLIVTFTMLSILPLVLAGGVSYVTARVIIQNKVRMYSKQSLQQLARNVEGELRTFEQFSNLLLIDSSFNTEIGNFFTGSSFQKIRSARRLEEQFLEMVSSYPVIKQIMLAQAKKNPILVGKNRELDRTQNYFATTDFWQSDLCQEIVRSPGEVVWRGGLEGNDRRLYLLRSVIGQSVKPSLGILIFVIDSDLLSKALALVTEEEESTLFVTDAHLNILWHSSVGYIGHSIGEHYTVSSDQESQQIDVSKSGALIVSSSLNNGWVLFKEIPLSLLEKDIDRVGMWLAVTILLTGGLTVFISLIIAGKYDRAIAYLVDSASAIADSDKEAKEAAEDALRRAESANRAKSEFLANMSHEFRTPLNAILGFAHLMARKPELPENERDSLRFIYQSGRHLLDLVNDVLDLSKIEAQRMELNTRDIDLFSLLDGLKNTFFLKAKEKQLELIFERSADVPHYIRADDVRLRQILLNLLSNALKFTKQGTVQLSVTTQQSSGESGPLNADRCLLFTVKDTGPGIAVKELPHLFKAFVQTQTGREAQEGTGLGLALSYKFARLMNGRLTVRSENGLGSTFMLTIPVTKVDSSEQRSDTARPQMMVLAPDQAKFRMLVVDDHEHNRRYLRRLLEQLGTGRNAFELREASNGKEAIESWQAFHPHMIWMDIRMSILDGYKAIQHIREAEKERRDLPFRTTIIAVTASSLKKDRSLFPAGDCDDFLQKPLEETDVIAVLHKHLGLRFVDAQNAQNRPPLREIELIGSLTPEMLRALPGDLFQKLEESVIQLSPKKIHTAIEEIRVPHAPLAAVLTQYAKHFRYSELLECLNDAK